MDKEIDLMDEIKGIKNESVMYSSLNEVDKYWYTFITETQSFTVDGANWETRVAELKVMERTLEKSINRARELMNKRMKACKGNLFNE
jgi:ubiquinone biosynthesis protein UbiJ